VETAEMGDLVVKLDLLLLVTLDNQGAMVVQQEVKEEHWAIASLVFGYANVHLTHLIVGIREMTGQMAPQEQTEQMEYYRMSYQVFLFPVLLVRTEKMVLLLVAAVAAVE